MSAIGLDGRVAVVTGAGRGLGRAYALDLAARGARVVVNDLTAEPAEAVVAEIRAAGWEAVAAPADVGTPAGGALLTDAALDAFGRVDVVVNNAGSMRSGYVGDLTDADIRGQLDLHLGAAFHVTRPAWRRMLAQGYGRVVLTASGAVFGQEAVSPYAAAKSGVLGLCRALAAEGATAGIRVNCVLPYAVSRIAVDNPVVGKDMPAVREALDALGEDRDPRSVAALVSYLASEDCAVSGNAYSALAGRFAQVVLGLREGWTTADPSAVTAEDIARHIEDLDRGPSVTEPRSILQEIQDVAARSHPLTTPVKPRSTA